MFEYIVKDRALRNYFRGKRDRIIEFEERASGQLSGGDMDISSDGTETCKRSFHDIQLTSATTFAANRWKDNHDGKRRCL